MINTIRPSGLFRREHCPGSAKAEAAIPKQETKSEIAARGNRIHEAINSGLRNPDNRTNILASCDDIEIVEACWKHAEELYNGLTDTQKERAIVGIEVSVDLSAFGMDKGTPDFYIYIPNELLILRDWKSGQGWVPGARWNLQLGAYACAIIGGDISATIDIGIFQPLVRSYADCWKTSAIELSETAERIRDVVARCQKDTAPVVSGGWCQYCRAAGTCNTRLTIAAEVRQITKPVDVISALTISARKEFYERLKQAEKIISNATEEIERAIVSGELKVDGYGAGNGRKSRYWTDEQLAINELRNEAGKIGILENYYLKPVSIPQAESLFGKGKFESLTIIKEGKPTLKRL